MKEYIERKAAMKIASEYCHPANVREVVYCKECVHSRRGKESLKCDKHTYAWNNMNRWVNDDDFCCWGVKLEG